MDNQESASLRKMYTSLLNRIDDLEKEIVKARQSGGRIPRVSTLPSGVGAGYRVFYTAMNMEVYFDGTRWLTTHEYTATFFNASFAAVGSTAVDGFIAYTRLRTDRQPYFTRVAISTAVIGTNDGSNYWTYRVRGYDQTFSTSNDIWSFTSAADTVGVWTNHEGITDSLPSNRVHVATTAFKTGSPGQALAIASVYYRLIAT